jgi:hypothetical protein
MSLPPPMYSSQEINSVKQRIADLKARDSISKKLRTHYVSQVSAIRAQSHRIHELHDGMNDCYEDTIACLKLVEGRLSEIEGAIAFLERKLGRFLAANQWHDLL